MSFFAIALGKLAATGIRWLHAGTGTTWPGEIALRVDRSVLDHFWSYFDYPERKLVLIAGTNGKTTTSKMVSTIIQTAGLGRVRHNTGGANLDNGLVSTFLDDAGWDGRPRSQYFLFEIDEATLPAVLRGVTPHVVVLLNLFRDQLDRYGEVDAVAEKWLEALRRLPPETHVIVNGDDPHLAYIGSRLHCHVHYFGLGDPGLYLARAQHATDAIYCPGCGQRLHFSGFYFSHLGAWDCPHCGLAQPPLEATLAGFHSPLPGVYNHYNALAAALVGRELGLDDAAVRAGLAAATPAFGRMERVRYQGRNVSILLSKNPVGFNESLRAMATAPERGPVLLLLNDRVPDGRDVSWIWDVDFEQFRSFPHYYVGGDRPYDLAVRLKYAGVPLELLTVEERLEDAIHRAAEGTGDHETLWILATYSAMLEARKILVGRKIL